MEALGRVLHSNALILGPETEAFEHEFAASIGAKHCVAVTSGTTAIHLALFALGIGPGDEVITVANTCVPTVAAIRLTGAAPKFVDVREDDLMMDVSQLEAVITGRTRCILPVHLWGMSVDMSALLEVAEAHGIVVVEDCAQALGTHYKGQPVGMYGRLGCFSFYPTKNLGAYGDGGAIATDDGELAAKLRRMRMYGYDGSPVAVEEGMNARIAEMQAAILRIKLRHFPDWLQLRLDAASAYNEGIQNTDIRKPKCPDNCRASYHQYVIRSEHRERLMEHLKANDIGFGVHYPTPIHKMPAYTPLTDDSLRLPVTEKSCNEVLSLPIHEGLIAEEIETVTQILNEYDREKEAG